MYAENFVFYIYIRGYFYSDNLIMILHILRRQAVCKFFLLSIFSSLPLSAALEISNE